MNIAAHELSAHMPVLAEAITCHMEGLRKDPTPERCEMACHLLTAVMARVERLAAELRRGDSPVV